MGPPAEKGSGESDYILAKERFSDTIHHEGALKRYQRQIKG